ncbi:hypothetical protein ACFL2I_07050 [Candidatus Omnitrophota bacterium]
MNKQSLLLIILICLPLTVFAQDTKTCASPSYEKEIKAVIILEGMTEEQVIQAIGEPFHKSPYKNMTVWWYPDRKFIYFKDNKVTEASFSLGTPEGEL